MIDDFDDLPPAAIVAMNTTLSAAAGGITALVLKLAHLKLYDVGMMCNGILGGLVSITAETWTVDLLWPLAS